MHELEPYPNWTHIYSAAEDERSPFYGEEPNVFEYSKTVYNYYIHPLWDDFGSRTLYLKVLYADYEQNCAIIEFIGEWNDAVENDIMELKRSVIDPMVQSGIYKFILIVENVLNFHSSDDSYYEEWMEDVSEEGGWIVFLEMLPHNQEEFMQAGLNKFAFLYQYPNWRNHQPLHLYQMIDNKLLRLLE